METILRSRGPDSWCPVTVLAIFSSDGQVEAVGVVVEILCRFEVMGDPPLLAQGGQGGEQGALHQLVLLCRPVDGLHWREHHIVWSRC